MITLDVWARANRTAGVGYRCPITVSSETAADRQGHGRRGDAHVLRAPELREERPCSGFRALDGNLCAYGPGALAGAVEDRRRLGSPSPACEPPSVAAHRGQAGCMRSASAESGPEALRRGR